MWGGGGVSGREGVDFVFGGEVAYVLRGRFVCVGIRVWDCAADLLWTWILDVHSRTMNQ